MIEFIYYPPNDELNITNLSVSPTNSDCTVEEIVVYSEPIYMSPSDGFDLTNMSVSPTNSDDTVEETVIYSEPIDANTDTTNSDGSVEEIVIYSEPIYETVAFPNLGRPRKLIPSLETIIEE